MATCELQGKSFVSFLKSCSKAHFIDPKADKPSIFALRKTGEPQVRPARRCARLAGRCFPRQRFYVARRAPGDQVGQHDQGARLKTGGGARALLGRCREGTVIPPPSPPFPAVSTAVSASMNKGNLTPQPSIFDIGNRV